MKDSLEVVASDSGPDYEVTNGAWTSPTSETQGMCYADHKSTCNSGGGATHIGAGTV